MVIGRAGTLSHQDLIEVPVPAGIIPRRRLEQELAGINLRRDSLLP